MEDGLVELVMDKEGIKRKDTGKRVRIVAGKNLEYQGFLHTKDEELGKAKLEITWAIPNFYRLTKMNGFLIVGTQIDFKPYIEHNYPQEKIQGIVHYQAVSFEPAQK